MGGKATRFLFILGVLVWFVGGASWGQTEGKKSLRSPASSPTQARLQGASHPSIPGTSIQSAPASVVRPSGPEQAVSSSLQQQPGRTNGITEYGALGVNGIALGFGDSSSYIAIPYSPAFYQNIDGTIEMWIYPTQSVGSFPPQELVSKGTTQHQEFLFGIYMNKLYFRIDSTDVFADGDTIPVGRWSHVAVTWTGGGPYVVNFYLNGAFNGSTDTLYSSWSHNTDSLVIGAAANKAWWREAFTGYIDEVRFWNPALPQARIALNRFLGLGNGYLANDTSAITWATAYNGLIDSWTFNGPPPAYDDIGGNVGFFRGSAFTAPWTAGEPMPYNFALLLPGDDSAYVKAPTNTGFDQNVAGSVEMWVRPLNISNTPVMLSKGSTSTMAFAWGISRIDSTQFFRIGTTVYDDTSKIKMNAWSHLAVTWSAGPDFIVKFYHNGTLTRIDTSSAAWNINTDPLIIGGIIVPAWSYEAFTGYIDEVRFWHRQLTTAEIQSQMFVSGRALSTDPDLYGHWNFDGNLNNFGHLSNINGSFNNGKPNDARLTAYRLENFSGPPSGVYGSHSTVLNWYYGGSPNPWPVDFTQAAPFKAIPDDDTTGIVDSMVVTNPVGTVSSVTAFLAIDHTFIGDLQVRLVAPNGQSRLLLDNDGDGNENALTFFDDGFGENAASNTYFAPWGYLHPMEAMGNFGSSTVQGTWKIKVLDNAAFDVGVLKGWGLRFVNTVGVKDDGGRVPVSFALEQNYPNPFNPSTTIRFGIPRETEVSLVLYNILGQQVATLINETVKPGNHSVIFNASQLASGTYFYRLTAGSYTATKKMMLIK